MKGKPKRTNTTEKGKAMRKAEATLSFDEWRLIIGEES